MINLKIVVADSAMEFKTSLKDVLKMIQSSRNEIISIGYSTSTSLSGMIRHYALIAYKLEEDLKITNF